MSPAIQRRQIAASMERERRQLELLGVRKAVRLSSQIVNGAIEDFKNGYEPGVAIRQRMRAIVPELAAGMLAGHLTGIRRTFLLASPVVGRAQLVAATAYEGAIGFLRARLSLSDEQLAEMSKAYGGQALRVVNDQSAAVEREVQREILRLTEEGADTKQAVRGLREAFGRAGVTAPNRYALEGMFRTQTQIAYAAGREQSLQDEVIQEELWGFEYVAVGDDRTTPLCVKLNGSKRAKDDPFWTEYSPPNHFSCRSAKVEIWKHEKAATNKPLPDDLEKPEPGFDVNFGDVFTDMRVLLTNP